LRTLAQAKRERRELMRDIALEHKRRDREKLAKLKAAIRSIKARRKEAMRRVVGACRVGRVRARHRGKERIQQIRAEAKAAIAKVRGEEIARARMQCAARKSKVKGAALSAREQRRALLRAERILQRELAGIENRMRKRARRHAPTAAERRAESDDEVRFNLPPELVPIFERIKRQIRGSERRSRTEEMLHYAEENPNEVIDAQEQLSRREIARLVREEHGLRRAIRESYRPPTAAELAAIPF
jgi:hypothetical protein